MKFTFRKIMIEDYSQYLELIDNKEISLEQFIAWIKRDENRIYVVLDDKKVISTVTLQFRSDIKGVYSVITEHKIDDTYKDRKILEKLLDLCIYKSHKSGCNYILFEGEYDISKLGFYNRDLNSYKLDFHER